MELNETLELIEKKVKKEDCRIRVTKLDEYGDMSQIKALQRLRKLKMKATMLGMDSEDAARLIISKGEANKDCAEIMKSSYNRLYKIISSIIFAESTYEIVPEIVSASSDCSIIVIVRDGLDDQSYIMSTGTQYVEYCLNYLVKSKITNRSITVETDKRSEIDSTAYLYESDIINIDHTDRLFKTVLIDIAIQLAHSKRTNNYQGIVEACKKLRFAASNCNMLLIRSQLDRIINSYEGESRRAEVDMYAKEVMDMYNRLIKAVETVGMY